MACFHPRDLLINRPQILYKWIQLPNGRAVKAKDPNGKPIVLGRKDKYVIQVPCGKCPACLALQQSQWSFRIEQEALNGGHASVLFVTFTYAPEFLPADASVHKEDVKRYLHDLRQKLSRRAELQDKEVPKVRYYFCAEYGSKLGRPHYHAILFFSHSVDWRLIQSAWGKGIVDIRPFTPARAGYVAKYAVKDISLDYAGRNRPFHLQSLGLGKCFLDKFSSFASLSYNTYFRNSSGRKVKLPRYYIDKLGTIRRYYVGQDITGSAVKKSSTFHTFEYDYTNTLSYLRFCKKEELEIARLGGNERLYFEQQSQMRISLEHELLKLSKNSSYNILSKYEQRKID